MVAHAIRSKPAERGPRPFEPGRDLSAVARLLEEAFRSEHSFPLSDTPILRELGIALWTLSYAPVFPENVTGFVWVEDGRVVGNVTISQDDGRLDRYLVSNVAVKPDYRRQGIARALMQMTIDHLRARGAKWALLNVRPNNPGAIQLYRGMGFQEIETRAEWSASNISAAPAKPIPGLRALRGWDQRAVSELHRAATPASVQQVRFPLSTDLAPSWEDRLTEAISDFFIGQATHRRVLERNGRIVAMVTIRGQRIATPHRLAIQVHPDYRGWVERELVAFALADLSRFPRREIRAAGTSTHPELITALEEQGFVLSNGLMLMSLAL